MKEFDEYHLPKTKEVVGDMSRYRVAEKPKDEEFPFEHWVGLTAKLVDRTYYRTFKMVEKWPLSKIIERYQTATKHHGNISPSYKWWAERKRDK